MRGACLVTGLHPETRKLKGATAPLIITLQGTIHIFLWSLVSCLSSPLSTLVRRHFALRSTLVGAALRLRVASPAASPAARALYAF